MEGREVREGDIVMEGGVLYEVLGMDFDNLGEWRLVYGKRIEDGEEVELDVYDIDE